MLKHRPTDRSHTCIPPDAFSNWTHQKAQQQGTESNGYRGMGPGERVRSVNEHLSHHRVVSGQLHNAQNTGQPTAHTRAYHQMRSRIGRTPRRLSRAPRVTDIVAWGQVSGSDR